jgi:UPF0716 protein FxsA
MSIKNAAKLLLWATLPVADVGTLFALAHFIGAVPTLALVLVSSVVGLTLCGQHLRALLERSEKAKKQYGEQLPKELQIIAGFDILWTLLLMALYIFPGLLSDALAFFFLMPPVKQWLSEGLVEFMRKEAERRGKSLDDVLRGKHQTTTEPPNSSTQI